MQVSMYVPHDQVKGKHAHCEMFAYFQSMRVLSVYFSPEISKRKQLTREEHFREMPRCLCMRDRVSHRCQLEKSHREAQAFFNIRTGSLRISCQTRQVLLEKIRMVNIIVE